MDPSMFGGCEMDPSTSMFSVSELVLSMSTFGGIRVDLSMFMFRGN